MNNYFRKNARQNDEKQISRCIVAYNSDQEVVGYACWNNTSAFLSGLAPEDAKGLPGYPLPAILVSRLAVDVRFQGKGYALQILRYLFITAIRLSKIEEAPSFRFIIVDAIDEKAKQYYLSRNLGFKPLIDKPLSLYLAINTIEQALGSPLS